MNALKFAAERSCHLNVKRRIAAKESKNINRKICGAAINSKSKRRSAHNLVSETRLLCISRHSHSL